MKLLGTFGAYMAVIGCIGGFVSLSVGAWSVATVFAAALLLGSGLIHLDPGRLPSGVRTLGQLAERTAVLSRVKLQKDGARTMPGEEWRTLTAIAAEHSGLKADELGPETYLFRHVYLEDRKAIAAS